MSFPSYPKYKPSNVEWLGDVPEHWSAGRLRHFARRYSGGTPDKTNLAYWQDGVIPWLNSGAVNDRRISEPSTFITAEAFANSSAKWVPAGALVMALAGQGKTKGMVAQLAIPSTCNQSMAAIVPNPKLDARFLFWWLDSNYQSIRNLAGGDLRDGLNLELVGGIPLPVVPLPEQTAIAEFLDRETGRIDELVAEQRRLMELLKEKRQIVISHAVTKGLNPQAPMRPSGTEWLGKVPEHWKLRRLKEVGVLKGGAGFPPDMQDVADEELPFYKVGDLKASMDGRLMAAPEHTISREIALKLRAAIIPIGSILYAKIGAALSLNRRRVTFCNCCIDNNMTAYTPQKKFIRTDWAFYWLSILNFDIYKNPGAVPSLSEGDQGALPILVPPLEEQIQIADFLADETAKIDELVVEAQSAIDLLQERRSALISAAVTGHIDVRQQPGI